MRIFIFIESSPFQHVMCKLHTNMWCTGTINIFHHSTIIFSFEGCCKEWLKLGIIWSVIYFFFLWNTCFSVVFIENSVYNYGQYLIFFSRAQRFPLQITGWPLELMAYAYLVVSPPNMSQHFEEVWSHWYEWSWRI